MVREECWKVRVPDSQCISSAVVFQDEYSEASGGLARDSCWILWLGSVIVTSRTLDTKMSKVNAVMVVYRVSFPALGEILLIRQSKVTIMFPFQKIPSSKIIVELPLFRPMLPSLSLLRMMTPKPNPKSPNAVIAHPLSLSSLVSASTSDLFMGF